MSNLLTSDKTNRLLKIMKRNYKEHHLDRRQVLTCPQDGKKYSLDILKTQCLTDIKPFNLNNVVLKKSEIHGLGLFARHPIKKDEIITFYPGDIIEYMPNGDRDQDHHIVAIFRSPRFTQLYGATKDIKYRDNDYAFDINKNYTIIGCTHFKDDPTYMGHFINDAAKADESHDSIRSYQKISIKNANCKFKSLYDLHIAIVATRDIVQGEELFLSYGLGYWVDREI